MNKVESLEIFNQFGKGKKAASTTANSNCVIYTRVSTKEQADNNLSLETQKKYCENFAIKNNYITMGYFGGTYESAKNDERKEFKRMLDFVKKSKQEISIIIVYSFDRFSRSGANAIYIINELKIQGIIVQSVTQPTDTFTPSGSLQQNIQFIFSQYDNDMRREKCMSGTREKLLKGDWCGPVAFGYDTFYKNNERMIVVNDKGKLLRKAFIWKADYGLTNVEIIEKLKLEGLKIVNQRLSDIFRNPFYCGLIAHGLLEGQVVKGNHEKLISEEIFLKANDIVLNKRSKHRHNIENPEIPLKRFIKCDECNKPFVGYIVKKKGIYYYKCNTKECNCNRNAKMMNNLFLNLLSEYSIEKRAIPLLEKTVERVFFQLNKSSIEEKEKTETSLEEVEKKLEMLQEKYILEEINKPMYDKFYQKYIAERQEIYKQMSGTEINLSNLSKYINYSLTLATNLHEMWSLGDYNTKEALQYMVFPDGIEYDRKNHQYRTNRVNIIFDVINRISKSYTNKKSGQDSFQKNLSALVPLTGVISTQMTIEIREIMGFMENNND